MTFSLGRTLGRIFVAIGLVLVISSTSVVLIDVAPAQAAIGDDTSSAVTVSWRSGRSSINNPDYNTFKDLVVKVNQTSNLSHQGIAVSWSGSVPTSPLDFSTDYLQVMQCWGDTPKKCQYGAPTPQVESQLGYLTTSRTIDRVLDPRQAVDASTTIAGARPTYAFPFDSVDGSSTFQTADLFSSSTTNEVNAARTSSNGTGFVNFEVQTTLEAPHMGCGADTSAGTPRRCYLVIVPRGSLDPSGTAASDSSGRIGGSPLTYAAWRNRITIPLDFVPVGYQCPLGQNEKRVVGSEVIAKAITSWQPALCGSGTTYGFSMIGDDEARAQIVGDDLGASRMAIVSEHLSPDSKWAKALDYAPIAQSAIVIAYNIDYSLFRNSSLYGAKNGTKVRNLKLNQRLVAKLLTQTYREDNPGAGLDDSVIRANPSSLITDPEFLSLNPDFEDFTPVYPQGLLVQFGNADVIKHVWMWIRSNADALAFLNGSADPWGTKINPEYSSLGLSTGDPSNNFPKADLSTYSTADDVPGFGSLDLRPYFNSMDESALRALKGDGNVKTSWDPFKLPPSYTALPPQPAGQQIMLAITDNASAYRYGLNVAELQGSVEGDFLKPDSSTMAAEVAARNPATTTTVATTDWTKQTAGAYPLTEIVYGVVNVCSATKEERLAYAHLLEYAIGEGQNIDGGLGNLPLGYEPVNANQIEAARSAISDITSPKELAERCPAPETTTTTVVPPVTTVEVPTFTGGIDGPATRKKLFILKPIYGSGETSDRLPTISRILSAGGYALGIPLMIIGALLLARAHRQGVPRLR